MIFPLFRTSLGLLLLLVAMGCGDASTDAERSSGVETSMLTVFVRDAFWTGGSLEYSSSCTADGPEDAVVLEGELEPAGEAVLAGDEVRVWEEAIPLSPGTCTVQLRARDDDREVMCTATKSFEVREDTDSLFMELDCFGCPDTELPGFSIKSCPVPLAGLDLTAATPAELGRSITLSYQLEPTNTVIGGGAILEGDFNWKEVQNVDLGDGPVRTYEWWVRVGLVEPWTYDLLVTASDPSGEPVCSSVQRIEVTGAAINRVHVVLPCNL